MRYRRTLFSAGVVSCGAVIVTFALAAFNASDPDPFDLPPGTVIRDIHVLSMEGAILSATEKDEEGSYQGDLKTLGTPIVDGSYRGSDQPIDWGEEVDLGAFYNAGERTVTVAFESRLVIELEPGEVAFASSSLIYPEIVDQFIAADNHCKCRCKCSGCGLDTHTVPCAEVEFVEDCDAGDCDCLGEADETCVVGTEMTPDGGCEGSWYDCERVWISVETAN